MNVVSLQGMSTDKVINPLGQLGVVSNQEKLKQDMVTLLLTRRGSVPGNPLYGSNLHNYLFELSGDDMLVRLKHEIKNTLSFYYSSLNNLEVETSIEDNGVLVSIGYTTLNSDLSTSIEFSIPIVDRGGVNE